MKKILCPTDFSDTAQNAIAYAAKLAQATNCTLYLLHVKSIFDVSPAELVQGKDFSLDTATKRLEQESLEISKAFRINCYAEVEKSFNKLSTIIREKSKTFDLIVMGSNGPDDLYQFFGGSNTYNAIVKADVPILVIPEGYEYHEIISIVYSFDYFRQRNLPLNHLLPIIKALKCELKVVQIMEESYSEEAENYLHELQTVIKNSCADDIAMSFDTIHAADSSQAINSYVLRNQDDILALCSVHRNIVARLFHKSVIKNLGSFCSHPLYVFHQ